MFTGMQHKLAHLVTENASAVLTGVGAVGAVGTAVLTGRASFKAAELIREDEQQAKDLNHQPPTTGDKVRIVWPLYLPPVGLGAVTVTSIVMANRVSAKRAAALAAAYGVSEQQFREYREKALEKLGVKKEEDIRAAASKKRIDETFTDKTIIIGDGDALFMDLITGRYFRSSVQAVSDAMNEVHREIANHMYCSFSTFCVELGIEPTEMTELLGWDNSEIPHVEFDTNMTPDKRPCVTIRFNVLPKPGFDKFY